MFLEHVNYTPILLDLPLPSVDVLHSMYLSCRGRDKRERERGRCRESLQKDTNRLLRLNGQRADWGINEWKDERMNEWRAGCCWLVLGRSVVVVISECERFFCSNKRMNLWNFKILLSSRDGGFNLPAGILLMLDGWKAGWMDGCMEGHWVLLGCSALLYYFVDWIRNVGQLVVMLPVVYREFHPQTWLTLGWSNWAKFL